MTLNQDTFEPDYIAAAPVAPDGSNPDFAIITAALAKPDADKAAVSTAAPTDAADRLLAIDEIKNDILRGADLALASFLGDAVVAGADIGIIRQASVLAVRFSDGNRSAQSATEQAIQSIVAEHIDIAGTAGATAVGRDSLAALLTNLGRLNPSGSGCAANVATIVSLAAQIDALDLLAANFAAQDRALVEQSNALVFQSSTQGVLLPSSFTARAGVCTVVGRIFDGDDFTTVESRVTVTNVALRLTIDFNQATVIVNEGAVATLTGTYFNPGGAPRRAMIAQTEGMAADQRFGTVTFSAPDSNGRGTWTWTHMLDDGPHDSAPRVIITAFDNDLSQANPGGTPGTASFALQVVNVGPTITLPPVTITEGDSFVIDLSGAVDPSSADHPSSADQAAGFTCFFNYNDGRGFLPGSMIQTVPSEVLRDNGELIITARIVDKDGTAGIVQQRVTILNANPVVSNLQVTGPIEEMGVATLTGQISDAGLRDDHTIDIDWGDRVVETFSLSVQCPARFEIVHSGSGFSTTFGVAVSGGSGTGMTVHLLASADGRLAAIQVAGAGTGYNPGDILTVGNATVRILALREGGVIRFTCDHQYRDDARVPAGKGIDLIPIRVTARDDDGGVGTGSVEVTVRNADPAFNAVNLAFPNGSPITLNGSGIQTIFGGITQDLFGRNFGILAS